MKTFDLSCSWWFWNEFSVVFPFVAQFRWDLFGGNAIDLVGKTKNTANARSPVDILVNYVDTHVKGKCLQRNKTMKKSKRTSSTHDTRGGVFDGIKVRMMACVHVYLIECSRNRVWLMCKQSTRPLSEVVNKVKMKPCWTLSHNDFWWRCTRQQRRIIKKYTYCLCKQMINLFKIAIIYFTSTKWWQYARHISMSINYANMKLTPGSDANACWTLFVA